MFRQPPNHILPISYLLLNMVKKRYSSYSILSKFVLTIQDLNGNDPIPRLTKIDTKGQITRFCSGLYGKVIVEKKIDGISCYLTYKNGRLIKATTKHGWNVTRLIAHTRAVPKRVDKSFNGGVRGELYISKRKLASFNKERAERGLRTYRSPVSAIMGLSKAKSTNRNKLDFHGFLLNTEDYFNTQTQIMRKLQELGINKYKRNFYKSFTLPDDLDVLYKYVKNCKRRREEFEADIDGVVMKADLLTSQRIGKKIVAFKYYT